MEFGNAENETAYIGTPIWLNWRLRMLDRLCGSHRKLSRAVTRSNKISRF
jgi:hypothetical protein